MAVSREMADAVGELKVSRAGQTLARFIEENARVATRRAIYATPEDASVARGRAQVWDELATLFGVAVTANK